jgi:hypothetical protein
MPLKKGKSKMTISSNIGEMVGKFKKTGKIGTSAPKSKKAAVKQAAAIAYESAGKTKPMRKGGVMGPVKEVYRKDAFNKVKIY